MRPMRRGACPSLAAPMPTGDGLLVRLSPVDRALSGRALAGLAEAAGRFGNGVMEVTARGSLQVRGLAHESAALFSEAVAELGIDLAEGVAVETGPLAGLDPDEIEDARPLAAALRRAIAASGLARSLGPKVSVVVDGGGALRLDGLAADLRLEADGGGRWRCGGAVVADPVAHALERLAAIGRLGRRRADGPSTRGGEPIGVHRLKGGGLAFGVGLPFGQVSAEAMRALAASAPAFRLAPGRAILAVGVQEDAAASWSAAAAALGFVTDAGDPRRAIAACPGCPACASGEIPAREMAQAIAGRAAALLDGSLTLHVSGCAKGCAHPRPATLALIGRDVGCEVLLDGTSLGHVRPAAAVEGLGVFAGWIAARRLDDETAADCLARAGSTELRGLFRGVGHA